MKESKEHIKLKRKAKKFLKSLGFEDITTEYPTGVWYCGHYASSYHKAHVDIVGLKENRIALVECGTTPVGKLRTLARHFEEVYHLHYGREIERMKRIPKTMWWEI